MFHYRNQGADYSRVLVGLQCAGGAPRLTRFLDELAIGTGTKRAIRRIDSFSPDGDTMLRRYSIRAATWSSRRSACAGRGARAVCLRARRDRCRDLRAVEKAESAARAPSDGLEFIEIVDLFLSGPVLLMISLGFYELFISSI